MGLFKKKEPRVINENDPLFIKLWYGKRSHAAIVLGLYFIFFIILLVMVRFSNTKEVEDNSIKGVDIKELFEPYTSNKLSYNFVLKDGNKTYYFSGEDTEEDEIFGTLLYNGDSSTVKVFGNDCSVGNYEKGKFVPQYSLCPENIKYEYFDVSIIYDLIIDIKGTEYSDDKYYLFDLDGVNIKVYYTDDKKLEKVVIDNNKNLLYELTYAIQSSEE